MKINNCKILLALVIFSIVSFGQVKQSADLKFKADDYELSNKISLLKNKVVLPDSLKTEEKPTYRTRKSAGLAFIYGLLIPGMGHVYVNNFKTGKYFMIAEAAMWLTYAAFGVYGNWLLDDAYNYAVRHAGINNSGKEKDDDFYLNIANYDDVLQYNNEQLLFGEYDKVYLPGTGFDFYWDQVENRKKYREDKLAADRTLNDRQFIIGAVLINHIASAISAIFATGTYNDNVKKSSGGFTMKADVMRFGYKVDGIKLNLTKWF